MKTEKRNRNPLAIALGGMDATVTNAQWSLQSKLPRLKSAGMLILILALAFIGCDDKPDDTAEEPEYRTAEITFSFIDEEGNPAPGIYKATVQGTMLLADWNNVTVTTQTRIENAQHNATGAGGARFASVFGNSQNPAVIIFDPNAGNGKLEVKTGEWKKLYINPTALNSITDAELQSAVRAMDREETYPPQSLELETKTYPITLKDGALTFTVAYKALPADEEPAYLAYIKERLEAIADSQAGANVDAVAYLISKGSSFTITIKYGEPSFTSMNWNTAEQSFEIHHDWISAPDVNLSFVMMRVAFEAVELD